MINLYCSPIFLAQDQIKPPRGQKTFPYSGSLIFGRNEITFLFLTFNFKLICSPAVFDRGCLWQLLSRSTDQKLFPKWPLVAPHLNHEVPVSSPLITVVCLSVCFKVQQYNANWLEAIGAMCNIFLCLLVLFVLFAFLSRVFGQSAAVQCGLVRGRWSD